MNERMRMSIEPQAFKEPGLYLFPDNGKPIVLTERRVRCFSEALVDDAERLPTSVWETKEFERCEFCPGRETGGMCQAMTPILTLFDELDAYVSFDAVTAVFRDENSDVIYAARTDMQGALKYVAMMSLMRYCRRGLEFWRYFRGIQPLMTPREIAETMYLNMYWLFNGDSDKIGDAARDLKETVVTTARRQEDRLAKICKNDALMNAYVETHAATMYLTMDIERLLKESFANFTAPGS